MSPASGGGLLGLVDGTEQGRARLVEGGGLIVADRYFCILDSRCGGRLGAATGFFCAGCLLANGA